MKILSISDVELGIIYSSQIAERFSDVDLVISCGDLPYYYLEYVISSLNVPLYHVRGNHANKVEFTTAGERTEPWGAINLHRKVKQDDTGLLLAGVEGSIQYNLGPYQYSQAGMWAMVLMMTPALFLNKLLYGRYLDVFVTHASPWKIHDMDDLPHHGVKAFQWFDRVFQPQVHLHGHIHVFRQDTVTQTQLGKTLVMNTYGYREFYINVPRKPRRGSN